MNIDVIKKLKENKLLNSTVRKVVCILSEINPVFATKILYFACMGQKLNLKNPKTFNEKLQYLKLYKYSNDSRITALVDKYEVRNYIKKYGEKFNNIMVELIGERYYSPDDINIECLPNEFVLKCTHDSGSVIICRNKEIFDFNMAWKRLNESLKKDYWKENVELQYKNVPKAIIIENYIDDGGGEVKDYKLYCFNGKVKLIYVSSAHDDGKQYHMDFFDINWNHLNIHRKGTIPFGELIEKPTQLNDMIDIARELSEDFPFVRVDFFISNDRLYLSEMTFVPTAGLAKYDEIGVDEYIGTMLELD